jgi:uncharacterized radical SAM superfamily Fe-S cluster-containing enzyme
MIYIDTRDTLKQARKVAASLKKKHPESRPVIKKERGEPTVWTGLKFVPSMFESKKYVYNIYDR